MKSRHDNTAVPFTKMSGTGNDFIVINNMQGQYAIDWSAFAARYCPRRTAVGADGVLIIEASGEADFNYRIFNADGSEAEMCGNGARCAALFAYHNKAAGRQMRFKTLAGIVEARVNADDVSIRMTPPHGLQQDIRLEVDGDPCVLHFINSGVPHAIVFTDSLAAVPVEKLGRAIRMHEYFSPAGTNVDFVQTGKESRISMRTYERGVEAETLACGTGAVASAIISAYVRNIPGPPVHVTMPGGELKIDFTLKGTDASDVWLSGPVDTVYTGSLVL